MNALRFKAQCASLRFEAYAGAATNLQTAVGDRFHITGWTHKAQDALVDQWEQSLHHEDGDFPWNEIFRRHRDVDRLDMAIWSSSGRLAALGLGLCTSAAVELRFLEGDPRPNCPLKGKRLLIALEASATYAQGRGRRELRVRPVNSSLGDLYERVYGFTLESPRNEVPYYRKGV